VSATADAKLRIGADVGPARAAVRGLQGDMGNLNGAVKTGQERIEKLATAVTGTSSVLGGMGAKAGAAAGAVSNLAMAFLAGGPLLAGMALATTAAAALANEFAEADKRALEAERTIDSVTRAIEVNSRTRLRAAAEEVSKLNERLATFGMGATESQRFLASGQRDILNASVSNLEGGLERAIDRRGRAGIALAKQELLIEQGLSMRSADDLRAAFELEQRTVEAIQGKLTARKQEAEILGQQIDLLDQLAGREKTAEAKKKANAAGKKAAIAAGKLEGGSSEDFQLGLAAFLEEKRREAFEHGQALDRAEIAAADKKAKELEKIHAKQERERTRLSRAEAKEREAIERQQMETVRTLAAETTGFLASVSMQLFDQTLDVIEQLAAGQEVAFAKIAASFIRSIGTQITGIGLRSTAEGLALAATLLMPGGQVNGPAVAAHLAIGTTLTGVGAQMAVGGAVTQGLLSRGSASGGDGALAGGSLSPRESSGGGGGGFGGGGDITINFNGGTQLGDPTERAVRLARDQRRAGRNVYIPPGT